MKIKNIIAYCLSLLLSVNLFYSCDYLDVVPDNVATLDMVFNNRLTAEQYLATCYSYVPLYGAQAHNPGIGAGGEFWFYTFADSWFGNDQSFGIANGMQNSNSPLNNYWDGEGAYPLFRAIRDCNVFIENVSDRSRVTELQETERRRWIAEGKMLKAFFHYYLFQLYGPIPLIKENIPVSATEQEVRVTRQKVDEVVEYIVELLDEAAPDLPLRIQAEGTEMGRFTQPAALSLKAKVLLLSASPLFNGNTDYSGFRDHDGQPFFNQNYEQTKWKSAADAAKKAIETAASAGHILYDFRAYNPVILNDSLGISMNIRGVVTDRFNRELIMGVGRGHTYDLQQLAQARLESFHLTQQQNVKSLLAVTFDVVESFYTDKGVPMEEDVEWLASGTYENRYSTKRAGYEDRYFIKENYETALMHYNREPRFYGSIAFDGSGWYGSGRTDIENMFYLEAKKDQLGGKRLQGLYSITGYWPKKLVCYENVINNTSIMIKEYPFPIIRLADLYLMYAEALTESLNDGEAVPAEVYYYLDLIRERSGLEGVKEAWQKYSIYPAKPNTKEGMREIIRRERSIELALETHRFFDIRRWKLGLSAFNTTLYGWSIDETETGDYYQLYPIGYMRFTQKDYLWPIRKQNLIINPQLIQNPGW